MNNQPNAFIAIFKLVAMIFLGFLLLYIFDTFVLEPFYDVSIIRGYVPNPIYTLMSYTVVFGIPIAIFIRGMLDAMEV